jgi:hypothetical protein
VQYTPFILLYFEHGRDEGSFADEEQDRRKEDKFASTLVIAASIIAGVWLSRDEQHLIHIFDRSTPPSRTL